MILLDILLLIKKHIMKTTKNTPTSDTQAKSTRTRRTGRTNSQVDGLRELFVDSLKDIYWAEKALTKALPKMAKKATSENLINTINDHLTVTEGHVDRLEQVFNIIGEKATAQKCEAMEGLIKEGESIVEETQKGAVRDAGIISASQKIEHYEIATYGTLAAFAQTLEEDEALELLQQTLDEEKEADTLLTKIAYNNINFEATEGEENDYDEI